MIELVLAAALAAPAPKIEAATAAAAPRDAAQLIAAVPVGSTCTLRITRGDTRGQSTVKARRAVIDWRWTVGPRAAPGDWAAQVKCGKKTAKRTIRVVAGEFAETGSSSLINPGSLKVKVASAFDAGVVDKPQAAKFPFPAGESVSLAAERRPDVIPAAAAAGVSGPDAADGTWDAWRWAANAQRGGLTVSTKPAAGALAVFPRGTAFGDFGHIAYVTGVNVDGTFTTEERGLPDARGSNKGRDKVKAFTRRVFKGTRFVR